jgi:flagellar basal body L-ring protein FlgH
MKFQKPIAFACVGALALSCAQTHITPYVPKRREYVFKEPDAQTEQAQPPGSLWHPGRGAALLFTDFRAINTNDLVVVQVVENANAQRTADTSVGKDSDASLDVTAFLQAIGAITGKNFEAKAGITSGNHFKGSRRFPRWFAKCSPTATSSSRVIA